MTDPVRRRAALTFVVVGAGYAGFKLTAQMARLTANLLPLRPAVHVDDIHWLLVDVAHAVMPELGASLGKSAPQLLRQRRVDVRLGVAVSNVTESQVSLTDGTVLDCTTLVWCAGVTANPLIATLELDTVHGRLVVDDKLRVPRHPEICDRRRCGGPRPDQTARPGRPPALVSADRPACDAAGDRRSTQHPGRPQSW